MKESAKNYKTDGGDRWVVTGTLEASPEAELIGINREEEKDFEMYYWNGSNNATTHALFTTFYQNRNTKPTIIFYTGSSNTNNPCATFLISSRMSTSGGNIYYFTSFTDVNKKTNYQQSTAYTSLWQGYYRLALTTVSGQVTNVAVTQTTSDTYAPNYLDTQVNYDNPYVPLYAGSPANKKYVDDQITATKNYTDIRVPVPPSSGSFILKSIDGITSWALEEA